MDKPRFGTLVVIVDRARNLPNRKKIGKQDAYAIVRLGHEVQRTPTDKRAGQVPNWNHEVRFQVPSEEENILKMSIFNEDSKVPDLIGDCAIDLTELYKKHEYDNWFDLKYKDKPAGEIYAELTFYYEGPPRPKPKVELASLQGTGRPQSAGPAGRSLPSIPPTSEAMRPPMRQRTMSPSGRLPAAPRTHELVNGMNALDLRQDSGYTTSPYQPGVRYAETWTGDRDMRQVSHTPAPGDVRRKSFSSEVPRPMPINTMPLRNEQDRIVQEASPRRNSYVDPYDRRAQPMTHHAHRYAASQGNVIPERFFAHQTGNRSNYGHQSPPMQPGRYSRQHSPTHPPYQDQEDHVQYVDPILDPRHGSPYELHGSPSIVSSQPDHAVNPLGDSRRNSTSVSFDMQYERGRRGSQPEYDYQPPNSATYGSPDLRRSTQHAQAQSMSYVPAHQTLPGRDHDHWSQTQNYHSKAASTSTIVQQGRSSFTAQRDQNYRSRDARRSMDQAAHSYDLSQQRRNTYAVTPAQYAAQNRPLPLAPDAPPSLPAKIPLGLTQEEYDILYGR